MTHSSAPVPHANSARVAEFLIGFANCGMGEAMRGVDRELTMNIEAYHSEQAQPAGRVLSVTGSQTRVGLFSVSPATSGEQEDLQVTVGKFLGIRRGAVLVVGIIGDVSADVSPFVREEGYCAHATVDLMGEIKR